MLQEAIESPFISKKIKLTSWENRNTIEDMLRLRRLMLKQKLSPAEGQIYFLLRNKYEEAYVNLLKETNPIKYQVYIEEQEKLISQREAEKIKDIERQLQFVEQELKEYEAWLAFQKRA
jgi:hypothetical protein